jgi:SecD/SecF fusion protein
MATQPHRPGEKSMRKLHGLLLGLVSALMLAQLAGCGGDTLFDKWDADEDGFATLTEVDTEKYSDFPSYLREHDTDNDEQLSRAEYDESVRFPWETFGIVIAVLLGGVALPFYIGNRLERWLRMPDYGWKIGLVLSSIVVGGVICWFGWPPRTGIDLSGGYVLIYEIDETKVEQETEGKSAKEIQKGLVTAISRRINPGGVKEVVVRPYGSDQIEVIIPGDEAAEIDLIKKLITQAGVLEFRIIAQDNFAPKLIEAARRQVAAKDFAETVTGEDGSQGIWVELGKEQTYGSGPPKYRVSEGAVLSDGGITRTNRAGNPEVLMYIDDYNVKGSHLKSARMGYDNDGSLCIHFNMTGTGASYMRGLTKTYLSQPDQQLFYKLGIVMDGELLSAPNIRGVISDSGQITGRFTKEEVEFIAGILKAGQLPAALHEEPISQNEISSLLGADTIRKGAIAIGISLVAVLLFMLFYYRFAGVVACFALMVNLVLITALMIAVRATFTLPGFAGLVLTVGMSVDANVLIFERIREELSRGSVLRMALRNGFARATTTIVDANLTTLITAIVLYAIGTDQIRGFAVTLILGILMSMYTAIFCSRIIFDIAERRRKISSLSMMSIIRATNIDFLGKRGIAAAASVLLIVVGLIAGFIRGRDVLDIDFNGGTSVQVLFQDETDIEAVRARATAAFPDHTVTVNEINIEEHPGRVFAIVTSIADSVETVQDTVKEKFVDGDGTPLLTMLHMEYADIEAIESAVEDETPTQDGDESAATSDTPGDGATDEGGGTAEEDEGEDVATPDTGDGAARTDLPDETVLALATDSPFLDVTEEPVPAEDDDASDDAATGEFSTEEEPPAEAADEADAEPADTEANEADDTATDSADSPAADDPADDDPADDDPADDDLPWKNRLTIRRRKSPPMIPRRANHWMTPLPTNRRMTPRLKNRRTMRRRSGLLTTRRTPRPTTPRRRRMTIPPLPIRSIPTAGRNSNCRPKHPRKRPPRRRWRRDSRVAPRCRSPRRRSRI